MNLDLYSRTRRNLHGLAEGLLAGPQYTRSGTIRLRIVDGAIATVGEPDVRFLDGAVRVGDRTVPVGGTFADLAVATGLTWSVPTLYADHAGVDRDDSADIDPTEAAALIAWLTQGQEAITSVWPDLTPVLWPEHFDLAVTVDEVNYGVSPGDATHPEPYAYVGPWSFGSWTQVDEFWNAPFGALRPAADLPDAAAVSDFFTAARDALTGA